MQSEMELMELMEPREPRELMDELLDVYVEHEAPNSDTRSAMVSPTRGNVGDDKGWDDKMISTAMEAGSGDTGYDKDM